MRRSLAVVVVIGLGLAAQTIRDASSDSASVSTITPGEGRARVVRVVDGDTVVFDIDGIQESTRLIGIDTPETKHPTKPVQCYGVEAAARTAALLPPGTEVVLTRDVEERDRYERLLAYVHRADDGLFVNLALVREGYASVATFPPNVAHVDEFVAAAADARRAGRGLWSDQTCGGRDSDG